MIASHRTKKSDPKKNETCHRGILSEQGFDLAKQPFILRNSVAGI
jgi:hypothetical protein